MLHPASAQSAPEALSNCLYPLQNPVAALHGYKGKPPLPPLSHTSAHTTPASVCYLAPPSVLLWPDYRFTRSKVFTAGAPAVVKYTSQSL